MTTNDVEGRNNKNDKMNITGYLEKLEDFVIGYLEKLEICKRCKSNFHIF